jgi:hypothetical protein
MNIILVLVVFAIIGGVIGMFSEDSAEGGCMGALAGLFYGGGCIVQVILAALPLLLFFWLMQGC